MECRCDGDMECDHITGECIQTCPAGSMGRQCNQRKIYQYFCAYVRARVYACARLRASVPIYVCSVNLCFILVRPFIMKKIDIVVYTLMMALN